MKALSFTIHESLAAVAALESPWRQLHALATYPSVFNGFDFFIASTLAFSCPNTELYVLLARDGDELIALFPFQRLRIGRAGLRLWRLEYAAQWETDKPYPLIRQGHEARAWRELSRFLAANRRDWHLLELVEMREGSTGLSQLPRLFRLPAYWLRVKKDFNTPLVALDGPWDTRWRTHPKMRKKLARMEKTFGDRLRFQVYRSPHDLDFCLDAYVTLESKGWKSGRVGIGRDARTLAFYRDFLARLAARDCLRVGLLFVDATPVAAEIAYIEGRNVFFAHGTYDEQLARFSPGMVSTTLFLRHFHAGGYLEGDYLAGFTGYLSPWADRILPSYHVKIARICLPVLVLLALKAVRRLLRSARRVQVEVEDGWMPSSWRQPD